MTRRSKGAGRRSAGSRASYLLAWLALLGLFSTVSIGRYGSPLDLPGPSGVWTEKVAPDDASEPAPADRAQASAALDAWPLALLAVEPLAPPAAERAALSTFLLDRCRPGHGRCIEHPPRLAV